MEHLIDALEAALEQKNWYAALTMALSLPDICGKLEGEAPQTSRARYVRWCEKYLQPKYTAPADWDEIPHVFLSGSDCYALRCALLHEGSAEIIEQSARDALDSFEFTVTDGVDWNIHMNQTDLRLQLSIDVFCDDLAAGAERWLEDMEPNAEVQARMSRMMRITNIGPRRSAD
ncbi:hypothetical protein FJV46_10620 [Arthrobacter agilis]|uniref:hypothetical protein n=1 Tax=Arthrobacter agilis TaxID=37921 RepID=UPI000B361A4A|nr:hypothetical protein [Arthrobacter agilis]OUM44171.1 hypothetical protein B8W74_04665 [Arthrobacter agilis]PPB46546.1 hypothetical protein CI784_06960 [Arthrobacter agilis]TPV23798.1 hypothetical protein FJV46_10620 [Arthrobacter agilis]VDR32530.1 Uncharacterised protein [Arthrobacter agilis]